MSQQAFQASDTPSIDPLRLLQAVPNPVIAINQDGIIVFANVAAEHFFHLGAKMLLRLGVSDLVSQTSPLISLVENVRYTRVSVNEYNLTIGTPRMGGERTADFQVAAVPEYDGMVLIQIMPRSIAEKIDRQLTHRDAVRTVSGMAAMLAHEIKNPLSGIRGAAQLLEPGLEADDKALSQLICTETDRIRDLVDQMEVFSDERPVARDSVNIHEVLDHVIAVASTGFASGRVIEQEYDPSLPAVLGSQDQLIQVFLNLLKNACEADDQAQARVVLTTAYRPGIHLSMPSGGGRMSLPLEVCVHNSGPPISDNVLPHLFEPFVTTKSGGKGLGLALVAKIISDHSGVVECVSTTERTTFRILLPIFADADSGDDREIGGQA